METKSRRTRAEATEATLLIGAIMVTGLVFAFLFMLIAGVSSFNRYPAPEQQATTTLFFAAALCCLIASLLVAVGQATKSNAVFLLAAGLFVATTAVFFWAARRLFLGHDPRAWLFWGALHLSPLALALATWSWQPRHAALPRQ